MAQMYQDRRVSDSDWFQLHSPERIADLTQAAEYLDCVKILPELCQELPAYLFFCGSGER